MYQRVELLGYVGQDPEARVTKSGSSVVKFPVATSYSYFSEEAHEKVTQTEWHNCTAFKRNAEIILEYVKKGNLIFIVGRNKTSKYEKDGQTHWKTDIIVEEVKLMPKQQHQQTESSEEGEAKPKQKPKAQQKPKQKSPPQELVSEQPEEYSDEPPNDDIPF